MGFLCDMGNCNHIDQARHNEEVCNHLSKYAGFSDWIITTAFYAATHYIRGKILPFTEIDKSGKNITFNDFESFYNAKRFAHMGRHEFTYQFLVKYHPKIADDFKILKGLSTDARYINYQMGSKNSNNARALLRNIRNYCISKK